jgi:hypothetical protein
MELSPFTMQVLKNFATINSNIVIKEGSTIMTVSEAKNVLGCATVEEHFPREFGIYDLNEFLNVLSLVEKPRVKFEEQSMLIGDSTGRAQIRYFFSDTEMLTSPSKPIDMPHAEVTFSLDQGTLGNLKRAASALGHSEVSITGGNGVVTLTVLDNENSTSNTYSIDVAGQYEDDNFNFIMNIGNLKLIPGDYNVKITSKLISEFTSVESNLKYWLALEKSSTYGA